MSRWHRENPEYYEQYGEPDWFRAWDGRDKTVPLKQVAPDRVVLTDDDREMCATCGELPANSTTWPGRCKRCERAIRDEQERDW